MKNDLYVYIIALLSCMACHSKRMVKEENRWNLAVVMESEKATTLEELADSVVYIPLETSDSCLLSNGAYLLYADSCDIFVRSNNCLFHFDANGHYLNKIGKKGMAPGEYARLQSVCVDKENRRLFYFTGNNKGQYWGYTGEFQKEINLQCEGKTFSQCITSGHHIVAEQREYTDKGLKTSIVFFDMDGNFLQEIPLKQDDKVVDISMQTVPLIYAFGDEIKYKDTYSTDLLSFEDKSGRTEWIFDLGEYEPSREYLEDMRRRETLMREMVQLVDIKESLSHFFLLLVHDYRLRGVVLDKESGLLIYSKEMNMPQKGGGMESEEIEGCRFWPSFTDKSHVVYGLAAVSSLPEGGFRAITRHALNHFPLTEESNPVVVKVILKEK